MATKSTDVSKAPAQRPNIKGPRWFDAYMTGNPAYRPPGTSVRRGLVEAAKDAKAAEAKAAKLRDTAKVAMRNNEKQRAGVALIQAVRAQREADIKKQKVVKTAEVLKIERQVAATGAELAAKQALAARTIAVQGPMATAAAKVQAEIANLKAQDQKLRAAAAVVAAMPEKSAMPSENRLATVAAKFDIRVGRSEAISRGDYQRLLSTLQDIDGDAPMGYLGAMAEYGNDELGHALAAIEMGNQEQFVTALQGLGAYATETAAGYPRKGCVPKIPGLTASSSAWTKAINDYADCAYPVSAGEPVATWNRRAKKGNRTAPPWTQQGRFLLALPSPSLDQIVADANKTADAAKAKADAAAAKAKADAAAAKAAADAAKAQADAAVKAQADAAAAAASQAAADAAKAAQAAANTAMDTAKDAAAPAEKGYSKSTKALYWGGVAVAALGAGWFLTRKRG